MERQSALFGARNEMMSISIEDMPGKIKKRLYLVFLFSLLGAGIAFSSEAAETIFPEPTEMVLVPEGEFIMGGSEKDGRIGLEVGVDAVPERHVYLKSFYIDKYEVTIGQYKKFMAATGHPPPPLWGPVYAPDYPPHRDTDPISDVSWYDADTYCRWVGKRLPAEEEWEKAARGTDGRRYPWGNEWKEDIANTIEYMQKRQKPGTKKFTHTVTEVGSFKEDVSPYGIYDMAGNVMEWTSSWYKAYPGSTLKRRIFGEIDKVMRGGAWMAPASPFSFAFNRHFARPQGDDPYFGVRCAKDAE